MRPVPSVLDLASRRLALPHSARGLIDTERVLAAAFRWGMRETSVTTVAVVLTMAADAVAISRTPLGQMIGQHVDVTHFIMRALYLVIFAFLIGYVAESEKRRAAEALSISQI